MEDAAREDHEVRAVVRAVMHLRDTAIDLFDPAFGCSVISDSMIAELNARLDGTGLRIVRIK